MQGGEEARRKVARLAKIERLRRQLHEMSNWRLAAAQLEREKLKATQAEMLQALSEGLMAYGPASLAGTRRVRAIDREIAAAQERETSLGKQALEQGRLAKLADVSLDAAREAYREGAERRGLEELIDASMAAATASRKPSG